MKTTESMEEEKKKTGGKEQRKESTREGTDKVGESSTKKLNENPEKA